LNISITEGNAPGEKVVVCKKPTVKIKSLAAIKMMMASFAECDIF
jgi:hypothetical protein